MSYQYCASAPYEAAQLSNREILERFIRLWEKIDETDGERRIALHWAAFKGCLDVVRFLLLLERVHVRWSTSRVLPGHHYIGPEKDIIER